MSEWINVKDRLPKDGEWVLVYAGNMNCMMYSKDNGFYDACYSDCFNIIDEVSHWMPLPEPPKTI